MGVGIIKIHGDDSLRTELLDHLEHIIIEPPGKAVHTVGKDGITTDYFIPENPDDGTISVTVDCGGTLPGSHLCAGCGAQLHYWPVKLTDEGLECIGWGSYPPGVADHLAVPESNPLKFLLLNEPDEFDPGKPISLHGVKLL